MKQTGGKANPALVGELLEAKLADATVSETWASVPHSLGVTIMKSIDRRTFVKAGALALAGASRAPRRVRRGGRRVGGPGDWRKAFMLGSLTKGPVAARLPTAQGGRIRGRRADQPQPARSHRSARRRDKTGLVIHGVSGGRHWQDPCPTPIPRSWSRTGRDPAGVPRLQGLRRYHRAGRTGRREQEGLLPRRLQAIAREHHKLIPYAEQAGIKIAIEEVWNQFPPEPRRVRPLHR